MISALKIIGRILAGWWFCLLCFAVISVGFPVALAQVGFGKLEDITGRWTDVLLAASKRYIERARFYVDGK